jgi:hypothetical protein
VTSWGLPPPNLVPLLGLSGVMEARHRRARSARELGLGADAVEAVVRVVDGALVRRIVLGARHATQVADADVRGSVTSCALPCSGPAAGVRAKRSRFALLYSYPQR